MDLSAIYTLSRANTGTDSSNMPDATLLVVTNQTYRDIINRIVSQVDEGFFYDEWIAATVIGQTEYTFPVRDADTAGLKKLKSVSIKYRATDTEWKMARPTTITNLTADKSEYASKQPESDPLYVVYDKSVSIYPAPSEVNQIKLYGISDPTELQAGATEADIRIPVDFHSLIVLGNEYKIHKIKNNVDEKNDSLAEYEREMVKMVEQLTDRIDRPLESEMPCLNHLK